MIRGLLLSLLCLLVLSCSLRRSNPLDPVGNDEIIIPLPVTNVSATAQSVSGTNIRNVKINWSPNSSNDTDGYYIYRGLAYNSSYARVGEVGRVDEFIHLNVQPNRPGEGYYYKVSAYKIYKDGRLEGRASFPPTWVFVPG